MPRYRGRQSAGARVESPPPPVLSRATSVGDECEANISECRKKRALHQAVLVRNLEFVESEVRKEEPDCERLKSKIEIILKIDSWIQTGNKKLENLLGAGEGAVEEMCEAQELCDRVIRARNKVKEIIAREAGLAAAVSGPNPNVDGCNDNLRMIKFPKIEVKQFDGRATEWLGFWAQFQKIHGAQSLDPSDKFQYLVQAMKPGTRARDVVDRYPQSAENYPKVIAALQDRFGNKKMLTQVYVRELIRVVLNNGKEKVSVSKLYDDLESQLNALESLGVSAEQMGLFLFPMVESCLPEGLLIAWQRSSWSKLSSREGDGKQEQISELKAIMEFLKEEVQHEDQRGLVLASFGGLKEKRQAQQEVAVCDVPSTAAALFTSRVPECVFCSKSHRTQECFFAQTLGLTDKRNRLTEKGVCTVCLRSGHFSKSCRAMVRCAVCHQKHFAIMCPELPAHKDKKSEGDTRGKRNTINNDQVSGVHSNLSCSTTVLLKTMVVEVLGEKATVPVRLVLDDASQQSYIRKATADLAGCTPVGNQQMRNSLFGGLVTASRQVRTLQVVLRGLKTSKTKSFTMVEEKHICSTIPSVPFGSWIAELDKMGITLSDHGGTIDPTMEILIGSDYWGEVVTGRPIKLACGLIAVETVFGWTLSGPIPSPPIKKTSLMVTTLMTAGSPVHELWKLEAIGISDPAEKTSREERDRKAKDFFIKTVKRKKCGRYSVALPWVVKEQALPTNKNIAIRRLKSATKKIEERHKEIENLFEKYSAVFQAWEAEGIIEKVRHVEQNRCHYLPHRPVVKVDSATTPIRPVFDASCKLDRTPSLNDCLERGPNLVELLTSSLLRFRKGKIGVISDIRKAYQMIEVREEDRDFLRFLWWNDRSKSSLLEYRHCRVVFGVNCSPFLLAAVLELHLSRVVDERKEVARKFWRSLYVDNSVTSVDNLKELEEFRSITTGLMAEMKMELRQWESNAWNSCEVGIKKQMITGVLGYEWNKTEDYLQCSISNEKLPCVVTKRTVLSFIQKVFDPLGFISPALLSPKLILQQAWEEKSAWDDPLSREFLIPFVNWWEEVSQLRGVTIPRHVGEGKEVEEKSLHGFGDASKTAYAAAIFLRSVTTDGVVVQLLQCKSRVAPIKKLTIPRLELMSSLITARLMTSVKEAIEFQDIPTFFWSDSSTALSWIKRNDEWGTFVGNRVKEIIRISQATQWRYVPGKKNPADLPSRGCPPAELLRLKWWEGPEWLKQAKDRWPSMTYDVDEDEVRNEMKKTISVMVAVKFELPFFARSSSYRKNVRILAYVLRFIARLKTYSEERGQLTLAELRAAEGLLLKHVQTEVFDVTQATIAGVRVCVDHQGILRVKTKLFNRRDNDSFKRPILLPTEHPIVEQLIESTHLESCHAGLQTLMGMLREKYWIIHSRKAVKRVVHRCVRCRRFNARAPFVPEAALPENRVAATTIFEVTGIDLAGPLIVKDGSKAWIVLYTCAVYRGVHLELVNSLSTEAFLLSLRKFIARRGRPSVVYTDNGRNFVGAANLFKQIDWRKVERSTGVYEIQWKFIPPSAPWWGGFWERLIGITKDLLRKTLGFRKVSYFQLEACVMDVEAVVNQRPLTYVTECEDDLVPLSPAMFMRELKNDEFPEAKFLSVKADDLRKKHQSMQVVRNEIRNRFRKEYLSQLVHTGKMKKSRELQVGEVVLVGDDNAKRINWPLGTIMELVPGKDSICRIGRVKTAQGVLLRPLQRLVPLEIRGDERAEVVDLGHRLNLSERPKDAQLFPRPVIERTRAGRLVKKPERFIIS